MQRFQTAAIVALRMLIGWHFLYEGLAKLTNPYWTAAGYLAESKGPLGGIFADHNLHVPMTRRQVQQMIAGKQRQYGADRVAEQTLSCFATPPLCHWGRRFFCHAHCSIDDDDAHEPKPPQLSQMQNDAVYRLKIAIIDQRLGLHAQASSRKNRGTGAPG